MGTTGYGVKVVLKRRTGPGVHVFVKKSPQEIREEDLYRISMNRTHYNARYWKLNTFEAGLSEEELNSIFPKSVVSCTKIVFRISLSYEVV